MGRGCLVCWQRCVSDELELRQEAEEEDAHYQGYASCHSSCIILVCCWERRRPMNLRSLRESISGIGSEHPPLRLLASIPARLTRSAASKLGSHEGAISVGSIEYEMRGRVVYISGTSGHRVHSRDIASTFSCNYVTKYTRLSRSVCIESGEPGNKANFVPPPSP